MYSSLLKDAAESGIDSCRRVLLSQVLRLAGRDGLLTPPDLPSVRRGNEGLKEFRPITSSHPLEVCPDGTGNNLRALLLNLRAESEDQFCQAGKGNCMGLPGGFV